MVTEPVDRPARERLGWKRFPAVLSVLEILKVETSPALEGGAMERKRLVADRFRRIWQIVEHIAREAGKSRRELADRFSLSERQVQADLNVIRAEMRLPLVRRQGYRFVNQEGGPIGVLELQEAQLLLLLVRQAQADRSMPADRLASLIDKLPGLFPPHLQPLIG